MLTLCLLSLYIFGGAPVSQEEPVLTSDGTRLILNEGHAFVEIENARSDYLVGEDVRFVVRFGIEEEFEERFQIQLFRAKMDVPIQISAPWLLGTDALQPVERPTQAPPGALSIALGDERAWVIPAADQKRKGMNFKTYEFTLSFRAAQEQVLVLKPLELRYAFATEFEESFLTGRNAANRVDALVRSQGLEISIEELGAAQAPIGFSGAIGHFGVRAEICVDPTAGDSFLQFKLHVTGRGNLAEMKPPVLRELEHFEVIGILDPRCSIDDAKTFSYDIVRTDSMPAEVPPVAFTYFDPGLGAYQTLHTKALRVPELAVETVDSLEAVQLPSPQAVEPVAAPEPGSRVSPWAWSVAVVLALISAGFGLWRVARGAASRAGKGLPISSSKPSAQELGAALTDYERGHCEDPLGSLSRFLKLRLGLDSEELNAKGLASRLESAGVESNLAGRAEATLGALLAARYGQGECSKALSDGPAVVQGLAQGWRRATD